MKYIDYHKEKKQHIVGNYITHEDADEKVVFIDSNKIPTVVFVPDEDIKKLEAVKKDLLKLNLLSDSFIFKYEKKLNDIVENSYYSSKDKAKMLMFISQRANVADIKWWKRESSKISSPKEEKLMTKEKLLASVISPEEFENGL